jgi:glycosyltransferase involved in cell wall biosynthesis
VIARSSSIIRVMHVFPVSEVGGAEAVSLNLIRYRSPRVDHTAIIVADSPGTLGPALTELGVEWVQIPRGRMRRPDQTVRAGIGVRRAIRRFKPDVIFSNSPQGALYAYLGSVGTRVRRAVYLMSVPKDSVFSGDFLETGMVLSRPDIFFTASQFIADKLRGLTKAPVVPVHHGTALDPVDQAARESVSRTLRELGVGEAAPIVLIAGRLQPWKGQHLLIEAFARVTRSHPDAHAVLLGGTLFGMSLDYPSMLQKRIEELGLSGRVHMVGHAPIAAWLNRADIVVQASTERDPFPNVCIEAMAAQRPLIINDLSGTCEVVDDGVHALIAKANDSEDLAMCIERLLESRELAATIAAAGHARYLVTCTPSHMVAPIEDHLVRLVASQGTNGS